jgi:hypothetical protein
MLAKKAEVQSLLRKGKAENEKEKRIFASIEEATGRDLVLCNQAAWACLEQLECSVLCMRACSCLCFIDSVSDYSD